MTLQDCHNKENFDIPTQFLLEIQMMVQQVKLET